MVNHDVDDIEAPRGIDHGSDPHGDEWLDLVAAAEHVRKSPRFLRRLVAERRLTYYKHGHYLAFRASDLDAWATSQCREAIR